MYYFAKGMLDVLLAALVFLAHVDDRRIVPGKIRQLESFAHGPNDDSCFPPICKLSRMMYVSGRVERRTEHSTPCASMLARLAVLHFRPLIQIRTIRPETWRTTCS